MVECSKCGEPLSAGEKFCASCGTPAKETTPSARKATPSETAPDTERGKVMAVLAYLGILCVIPLITGSYRKSPLVKWHLNQGLVLFISWIAWLVASTMIVYFLREAVLVTLFTFVRFAVWIGAFILVIIGIINAVRGRMKPLPLIGKIKILK